MCPSTRHQGRAAAGRCGLSAPTTARHAAVGCVQGRRPLAHPGSFGRVLALSSRSRGFALAEEDVEFVPHGAGLAQHQMAAGFQADQAGAGDSCDGTLGRLV